MQEPTHTPPADDTPTSVGWCYWHAAVAEGVRLISVVEQVSGPGGVLFACGPCRAEHNLTPFADR